MGFNYGYQKLFWEGQTVHVYWANPETQDIGLLQLPGWQVKNIKDIDDDHIHYCKANWNYFENHPSYSNYGETYGRNQGFTRDDRPAQVEYHSVLLKKDGTWLRGDFADWEYPIDELKFGSMFAVCLIHDGKDETTISSACGASKYTVKDKQTLLMGDGKSYGFAVVSGKLNGSQCREFAKSHGMTECYMGDSGGSSQMVVNGKNIYNTGRKIPNCLTIYKKESIIKPEPPIEAETQYSEFGMDVLRQTAGELYKSHMGSHAIDLGGKDGSTKDYMIAPFDCKIVKTYSVGSGSGNTNSMWFESLNPVITPNLGTTIVTFRCAHADYATVQSLGLSLGKTFKKGERIYREGNGGTSGAHIHFECGIGKIKGSGWKTTGYTYSIGSTKYSVYTIDTEGGSQHAYDCLWLPKDCNFVKTDNYTDDYPWKRLEDSTLDYTTRVLNEGSYIQTYDKNVRMRQCPTTNSGEMGMLKLNSQLEAKEVTNELIDGYLWAYTSNEGQWGWCALIKGASDLIEGKKPEPTPEPEPDDKEEQIKALNEEIAKLKDENKKLDTQLGMTTQALNEANDAIEILKLKLEDAGDKAQEIVQIVG